jgi:glycosyltransferase involved in cell wall biosynthesis
MSAVCKIFTLKPNTALNDGQIASSESQLPRMNELVTVILCAYNHDKFVEEAIDSVFAQDYRPIQLIISEDGSKDRTREVIEQKLRKPPYGIEVVRLYAAENVGLASALNRATPLIKGDVVVMQAGDDVAEPSRVRRTLETFRAFPRAAMVWSAHSVIDGEGRPLAKGENAGATTVFSLSAATMKKPPTFLGATCAYARAAFTDFAPLDAGIVQEDLVLPYRCLGLGLAIWLPERLVRYRVHGGNIHFGGFQQSSAECVARVIRLRPNREALARQARVDAERLQARGRPFPEWFQRLLSNKHNEAEVEARITGMRSKIGRGLELARLTILRRLTLAVAAKLFLLYVIPFAYATFLKARIWISRHD